MSVCSECRYLKVDQPMARKSAALGFAVCDAGVKPKTMDFYPIEFSHKCAKFDPLKGAELDDRKRKLKHWTDYLSRSMQR